MDNVAFEKSKIIWTEEQKNNQWVCFRAMNVISELPEKAVFKVAVDTKYWLWINGKMVVFEGGLNRESLPGCGYYDELDIVSFLINGENTFAFIVWYWGNQGRNNVDSGVAGILFECPELNLFSDEKIIAIQHPAYGDTFAPHPSYLYGGHNIGFDAAKDIGTFFSPGYDDSDWGKAEIVKEECVKKWGVLYKRPIPQLKFSEYKSFVSIEKAGDIVTAKLPFACHLTPYFKINAPEGLTIDIRTDHYKTPGGPGDNVNMYNGHRVEYITKKGVQEFEAYNWFFGEEVYFTIPESVEIISLHYRESGYDTTFAGTFVCDNEKVNELVEKCKRTLYICMRDNYMDCPDRERGQWIGDVSSQIPQTFYCLDRSADLLTKKAIMDFVHLKKGDVLVGNVPGVCFSELPSQSLNAISDIGMVMSYYLYSGDSSVINPSYDAVKKYLLLWDIVDDGLIGKRNGNWYWFDHLKNIDAKVLENCWYYSALNAAVKMAKITNNTSDITIYEARKSSIKENFDKVFMNEDGYKSIEVCDDRANAMTVLSGLASDSMKEKIVDVLGNTYFSTPYMEYYVLEALYKLGASKIAFDRMLKRYLPLIENENSTLWEDFEVLGTKNHAWSGGPLTIMYKYGAGIMPAAPGFEKISIMPANIGLKKIASKVQTVKGFVAVEMHYQDEVFSLRVSLPQAMPGTIGIPVDCFDSGAIGRITLDGIEINGITHHCNEISRITHDGNEITGRTINSHITVEVSGGGHELIAYRN